MLAMFGARHWKRHEWIRAIYTQFDIASRIEERYGRMAADQEVDRCAEATLACTTQLRRSNGACAAAIAIDDCIEQQISKLAPAA